MASYQQDVAVLNGLGRLKGAGIVTLTGTVVLMVGCAVSVPAYGGIGAAWSSLGAYTTMAIIARRMVRGRELPNSHSGGELDRS